MMMRGLGYGIFLHLQKFCRMLNGTYSYSGNSHCLSEVSYNWVSCIFVCQTLTTLKVGSEPSLSLSLLMNAGGENFFSFIVGEIEED